MARFMVAAVAVLLTGCSSSGSSGGGDKYQQTWTVPYGSTTCAQWIIDMTSDERFVAAHDFIIALHAYDQSDRFARTYARGITKDCRPAPQLKVKEVAAALATLDTTNFP